VALRFLHQSIVGAAGSERRPDQRDRVLCNERSLRSALRVHASARSIRRRRCKR